MLMIKRRNFMLTGASAIGLAPLSFASAVRAASGPEKPVRVVVPYSPGGSADTLGRLATRYLGESMHQSFVVDNKPGAGGVIGSQQVARSAPDGYTLVVSGIGSHVIAPVGNSNSFDPMKDFSHIAMIGGPPTVLVVNAATPVKTLAEFIAYVKAQPQGLNWASPGQGTHGNLIGEVFRNLNQLNMTHVGYKGASPAVVDLLGGQLPAAFVTLNTAGQHIKSGALRAIALTSAKRTPAYPNVPTFAELGQPRLTATTWFSLSGPAGMPKAVVDQLNAEVRKCTKTKEARALFDQEAIETNDMDAGQFTKFFQQQIDYWTPYVKLMPKDK
jgi:tripartite-type tricarboxylate transporter receptor subunit TctC